MPSQPFSASFCQNSPVTAASVAIIWRTNWVVHSLSRNLRAVSRKSSCSSVKPMSIPSPLSERHRAADDAAVHDAPVFVRLVIGKRAAEEAPVVPHDEVAELPMVGMDETPLSRMLEKLGEKGGARRFGEIPDVRRVV